ncbi:MAG TPA: nitroreductase family protein [Alphaproteobacteria bacterium]|nr:nitroreductase family protein [Alphaproteobacteria bacterium]
MTIDRRKHLRDSLSTRFGDAGRIAEAAPQSSVATLARLADHRVIRRYDPRPIDPKLVTLLCAVALSAPTKSDLQQRDIVIVSEPIRRRRLIELSGGEEWMHQAPVLLVVCGNNRRQRQLHEWRARRFANDHLDAFFNACVDAAIALGWLVAAAEAAGLGCCPISQIRNHPYATSELLALPDHVIAVAGLLLGWPADAGALSPRLPLAATAHAETFDDARARELVDAYDARRRGIRPYPRQRFVERFGEAPDYGWSEDKARQYSVPERADFGRFVRDKGFKLD